MEPDQVVSRAAEFHLTAPAVDTVAGMLARGEARAVAERAIEIGEVDAAALIMLAGLRQGEAPEAKQCARILPLLDAMDVALLLAWRSTGDRVGAILDVCESDQLSSDREVALLLLVTEILGDEPCPPVLKTRIRLLSRRGLEPDTGIALGEAALRVSDENVQEVAAYWVEAARGTSGESMRRGIRRIVDRPIREVLPDRPLEEVEGGYTIQREAPKVGRNDPCPCGSGKKWKRCCGLPGGPGAPTALRPRKRISPYSVTMTREQFEEIRPMDLRRLDPCAVADRHLVPLLQGLTRFAFWEQAEAAAAELGARATSDDPLSGPDGHRYDLFREALTAGRADVARRQMDLLPDDLVEDEDRLNFELLANPPPLLERIEDLARQGLEDPAALTLTELSYSLLERLPALGILVTRGALDAEREFDAWALLDTIEMARDRLLLSPGDPAWDLFDRLLDIRDESAAERMTATVNESLEQEVESLRGRLADEAGKSRAVQRRLNEAMASIRRVNEAAGAGSERIAPESGTPARPADEERSRLVARVKELQTLLKESSYEKTRLRQKLAESSRELARAPGNPDAGDEEPDVNEEMPVDEDARLTLRLPQFGDRFERSLESLPGRVARKAVGVAGELGGGAPSAWAGVKLMRSAPRVHTARLGHSWRLLFRIEDKVERLEFLEVVNRRDLERVLLRYR